MATLVVDRTCLLCGWRDRGRAWTTIRPSMRGYRVAEGNHLALLAPRCYECRTPMPLGPVDAYPDAETRERLDAWRARRRDQRRAA